jgi:hypothetical protein
MNPASAIPPVINPDHTITYAVTRWDVFVNWMTVMIRNRLLQIFIPASMVLCVVLRLLPQLGRESLRRLLVEAALYCLGFLVFLVIFQAILGLASAFLMPHRGVVGQHTLEITEAGLIERTDVNETLHRWPGVCRITSLFGYLFIYVGENNSHQVPKRAFAPEFIGRFEAEVRARMRR